MWNYFQNAEQMIKWPLCACTCVSTFPQQPDITRTPRSLGGSPKLHPAPLTMCKLFLNDSPISFFSCFMLPKLRAQLLLCPHLPLAVFQARPSKSRPTKTTLKRTSVTSILEFTSEQFRVPRAALDSLRLQSSDWGSHTRSSFLAELAGSQDGCHSKGCLEPPCRLRAWEHTGLSTNTSSELASRLFTEAGKASPSSTPLLGVYCPVGWALFPWRQSGSSSSCRDYQEDECEEGAEERPWALPCLDWGEGTTRTREQ